MMKTGLSSLTRIVADKIMADFQRLTLAAGSAMVYEEVLCETHADVVLMVNPHVNAPPELLANYRHR